MHHRDTPASNGRDVAARPAARATAATAGRRAGAGVPTETTTTPAAHDLLAIQAGAGNAAVQRLLADGSPSAGARAVQREPITLDPTYIADDADEQAAGQLQSDRMMGRFPEVWRGFCRDWYDAALNALATVPDLPDPYAEANFYRALAGNLLWAATSITFFVTNPAAGVVAISASFAGAAAGSGMLATPAPPSGRAQLGAVIATERDRIERDVGHPLFADVAADCLADRRRFSTVAAQDRALWHRFAPGIPFERRNQVMQQNATALLASWLQQFQQQYLAWKERPDVLARARDLETGSQASGPYGSPFTILSNMVGIGTPEPVFFELAKRDIPLLLVFSGPVTVLPTDG